MATVTLQTIRNEVYRRLGDDTNKNIVTSAAVDFQVNEALTALVDEAESLGKLVVVDSATISVAKDTDVIDLDTYLLDGDSEPNYRGNLFILRTDLTYPVSAYWPDGGEFRVRELYRNVLSGFWNFPLTDGAGTVIPDESVPLAGPFLYALDDRRIGYIKPPNSTQTLTAYYTPILDRLSADGDTLHGKELTFFGAWTNLVALKAALVIAADSNVSAYVLIERLYGAEFSRFRRTVGRTRRQVARTLKNRWD